MIKLNF